MTISTRTPAAVLLAALTLALLAPHSLAGAQTARRRTDPPGSNPITIENQKPGTTSWQIRLPPSTNIQGYASQISILPGQTLQMHVSTAPGAWYRINVYRIGWYRGDGARQMACVPSCGRDERGTHRTIPPPDPQTGYLDAGWPVTDTVRIGRNWVTGYYIAKLHITRGRFKGQYSFIPFVVRAPVGNRSSILVQASVNTWEAYNAWGGKSLYDIDSTDHQGGVIVSFNRPFTGAEGQTFFEFEIQLVRFLERNGYDVSYQTDVDTDTVPRSLMAHRLDIVSGHDEYWSKGMRDAFDYARDHGVNLAFIGADIGVWQLRYADDHRTLIEYRSTSEDPDPVAADKTVTFSDLGRPECELLGVGVTPAVESESDLHTYTVLKSAVATGWLAHTGLRPGSKVPRTVGYEFDGIVPGCAVPRLQQILGWQGGGLSAAAVTYRAPSGARVFSDGTLSLTWALDDYYFPGWADPRVQALFRNIFDSMGGRRAGPG